MNNLHTGICETVRIRDKAVEGGSKIINKSDVTDNDILMDDKPAARKGAAKQAESNEDDTTNT